MSFSDLVSGLEGSESVGGPAAAYTRGIVISQGVRAGESANSIVGALSRLGIGIRRDQALSQVRGEVARQAAGKTTLQLDLNATPSELIDAVPPPGWTGQFVHQVAVTYRSTDEEGNYLLHTRTMGIKSPTLLTSYEAGQAAYGIIGQMQDEANGSFTVGADSVLTLGLSGAWYDVQNRSLPVVGGGGGT